MTFPPTYYVYDIRLYVDHDDMTDVLDAIEKLGSEIGFDVEHAEINGRIFTP